MIISFYSYKGGVGRTQLVANIAAFLCFEKRQKVLLIDWDLEAPGLNFYFGKENVSNIGLIELFSEYVRKVRGTNNIKEVLPNRDEIAKHIVNLKSTKKGQGAVDLMPAGQYGKGYSEKINAFDWFNFYDALDGNVFIEYFKQKLAEFDYDYILIDSRTGISDYSGICNIQMPVANVVITVPNNQNFIGTLKIIDTIERSPYVKSGYRKPIIFPVLSRLDTSVEEESVLWQKKFIKQFKGTINKLNEFVNIDLDESYVKDTLLEYKRDLAFGEMLLFSEHKRLERSHKTLAEPYANLGEYLTFLNLQLYPKNNSSFNSKFYSRIRDLAETGRTRKALDELMEYSRSNNHDYILNTVSVLKSRMTRLEKNNLMGLITQSEFGVEYQKIMLSIIDLLSGFKMYDKYSSVTPQRQAELSKVEELLDEKLNYLKREHAIRSGGSARFALKKEIEEVENELASLRNSLNASK